jgi:hypothetical protein
MLPLFGIRDSSTLLRMIVMKWIYIKYLFPCLLVLFSIQGAFGHSLTPSKTLVVASESYNLAAVVGPTGWHLTWYVNCFVAERKDSNAWDAAYNSIDPAWDLTFFDVDDFNGGASTETFSHTAPGDYYYRIMCRETTHEVEPGGGYITGYYYKAGTKVTVVNPVPPSSFSYPTYDTNGYFSVTWSSVTTATRYELNYRSGSGSWVSLYSGSGLSFNASALPNGNYQYRVRSCASSICSAYKTGGTVRVEYTPAVPASISVPSYAAGSSATISWAGITWPSTSTKKNYELYEREYNGSSWGSWKIIYNGTSTSYPAGNLKHGYQYQYYVRTCNSACSGNRTGSNNLSIVYTPGTPTLSAAPTTSLNGSYALNWNQKTYATQYQLYDDKGTRHYSGSATTYSFTDIANGTYQYRVRACNSRGTCSAYSSYVVVSVDSSIAAPTGFTLPGSSTAFGFSLNWNSVENAIKYQVFRSDNYLVLDTTSTSAVVTVTENGSYSYKIRACGVRECSAFTGVKSIVVDVTPDNPTLSNLPEKVSSDFTVSWSEPSRAIHYALEENYNNTGWTTVLSQSTDNQYTVSIPSIDKPDGNYSYRVRACDTHGYCSAWSAVQTTQVDTVPVAGNIIAQVKDSGGINETGNYEVVWDDHIFATRFEVRDVNNELIYDGTATREQFNNQINGTYTYKYRACNQHGNCSPYSSVETITVQILLPPEVPTPITLPASSEGNYNVCWPEVDLAANYELQQRINSGTWQEIIQTQTCYSYNPAQIVYGSHEYRVRALNNAGESDFSGIYSVEVELDPTVQIRKQLYYNEADDIPAAEENPSLGLFSRENAAFRYLDLMYIIDLNNVINRFASGDDEADFSVLYSNAERVRSQEVENFIHEKLAEFPDNSNLQRFLLDVYYDRAVAEMILANEALDEARISRLRNESMTVESDYVDELHEVLKVALEEYWALIVYNPEIFVQYAASRGQISPRYRDENDVAQNVADEDRLFPGYKDVIMIYQMLTKLAQSKADQARLLIVAGQTNQTILDNMRIELSDLKEELVEKELAVKSLFPNVDFDELESLPGLPEASYQLGSALGEIDNAISWMKGDTNILGLPHDALLLVQGYGVDGNTTFDSYDAMADHLNPYQGGVLAVAATRFVDAESSYTTYRHNQDQLATEYTDRNRQLNNWLYDLVGWDYPDNCHSDECVILEDSALEGSSLSLQESVISSATIALERNEVRMENLLSAIEIEIERRGEATGIENAMEKVVLQYGDKQVAITRQITEIRRRAEKSRQKSGVLGLVSGVISGAVSGGWIGGIVGGVGALAQGYNEMRVLDANLKELSEVGSLQALSQQLAAEERATLMSLESDLLDVESEAKIRTMWLEANTIALDIAQAEITVEQEVERALGMLNQANRVITQIHNTNEDLAVRYFADPIHSSRLTRAMALAEHSFDEAQKWMFYAVNALEYKWQEPFRGSITGSTKAAVYTLRNASDLEDLYNELVSFDAERSLSGTQQASDIFSIKEDVFGYVETLGGNEQFYPHPDPDQAGGEWLTADEAFTEKLRLLKRDFGTDTWITIEFSSIKELPRSTFFLGPVIADEDDMSCLADGGSYLDKIESIQLNVPIRTNVSGETEVPAYLTYGGSSVIRSKTPGTLTDDELGIKDELITYSTRFWSVVDGNKLSFKDSYRQQMSAALTTAGFPTSEVTFVFKERSVAASGWRLSLNIADRWGDLTTVEDIEDIELWFKHRFISRNFDDCDGTGPLFNTDTPN